MAYLTSKFEKFERWARIIVPIIAVIVTLFGIYLQRFGNSIT